MLASIAARAGTAGLTAELESVVNLEAKAVMSSFKSSLAHWTKTCDRSAGRSALDACSRIRKAASAISANSTVLHQQSWLAPRQLVDDQSQKIAVHADAHDLESCVTVAVPRRSKTRSALHRVVIILCQNTSSPCQAVRQCSCSR